MIQIRRGVFETNSSSVHSICLMGKDLGEDTLEPVEDSYEELGYGNRVIVHAGAFGWGWDRFTDAQTKLDYLVSLIIAYVRPHNLKELYENSDWERLDELVASHCRCDGIALSEDIKLDEEYGGFGNYDCYVDHDSITSPQNFLNDGIRHFNRKYKFTTEEKEEYRWYVPYMEDFIFSKDYGLDIGNDNGEWPEEW